MGELFADMEKMDIQAERRNTANERKRADEAEERADKAEEDSIRLSVELCQELGASKDSAIPKLMEKRNLSLETAQEKVVLYWRE